MVYNSIKNLQAWLLPGSCVLCGAGTNWSHDICAACERSLPVLTPGCPICSTPHEGGDAAAVAVGCGRCQSRPPPYSTVRAPFLYTSPIDHLIQALKYGRQLSCARILGEYLAAHIGDIATKPDVVVPVPLHRARLRERGFNQSLELARPLAKRLGIPLIIDGARRTRPTVPQTGLRLKERQKNVRGAFAVMQDFTDKRIAIVDDVMTSGATVEALARALRQAGAGAVEVWVVARA